MPYHQLGSVQEAAQRRQDLHAFAQAKLNDAILLLEHERWSNSYYLAGYSVELALKACIAAQISADTIPDKSILTGVLSHEFGKLIGLAGLRGNLKMEEDANSEFAANWAITLEWGPDSRYQSITAMSAQTLVQAISDEKNGVLRWIKQYW